MARFVSTEQAIFLAPFVSTFTHDAFSALWAALYNGVRGNLKNVYKAAFKTKSGKFVMLAAVIGGPIGMTGYVLAINYMGASIGAVASAVFPAIGAILAYFFLKEKMQWYRWIFLLATLLGVYGLSYSPELNITDFWLGIVGAMMCAFGWGIEAVILAKCMQDPDVRTSMPCRSARPPRRWSTASCCCPCCTAGASRWACSPPAPAGCCPSLRSRQSLPRCPTCATTARSQ